MPQLPTITVTQAQLDRIANCFPGATQADKVNSYKAWLTNRLIDFVMTTEQANIHAALAAREAELDAEVLATLPPRAVYPPVP